MLKQFRISVHQRIFFLFVLFVLFEGWYCKYSSQRSNIEGTICNKYFVNFWNENGFIETVQVILVLSALILSVNFFFRSRIKIEKFFILFFSIGLFYYFGEEISWGQHYFHFKTPDILIDLK